MSKEHVPSICKLPTQVPRSLNAGFPARGHQHKSTATYTNSHTATSLPPTRGCYGDAASNSTPTTPGTNLSRYDALLASYGVRDGPIGETKGV